MAEYPAAVTLDVQNTSNDGAPDPTKAQAANHNKMDQNVQAIGTDLKAAFDSESVATIAAMIAAMRADIDAAGIKFIEAISPVNAATVEFVNNIDGTFRFYIVKFWAIPVTDNVDMRFRVSTDGGSTFKSGAADYKWSNWVAQSDGISGIANDNSDSLIKIDQVVGSDTGEGIAGEVTLFDPSDTNLNKHITWQVSNERSNGILRSLFGAGMFQAITAVNAIQFLFSSGNIESGEFVLYGVK